MNFKPLITATDLCKNYQVGPETIQVIDQLNLKVMPGERIAIQGRSGSGKSTLLNLLGALDNYDSGQLYIHNQLIHTLNENQRAKLRNQQLGFVYQFHHLLPEFNAIENVAMPLLIGKTPKKQAYRQATELLEQVGLKDRTQHKPSQLSGGERQRAAIARALVANPQCVLMDEPTGNLDYDNGIAILELINNLNQQFNISFVVVTHNETLAQQLDNSYRLIKGQLIKQ